MGVGGGQSGSRPSRQLRDGGLLQDPQRVSGVVGCSCVGSEASTNSKQVGGSCFGVTYCPARPI